MPTTTSAGRNKYGYFDFWIDGLGSKSKRNKRTMVILKNKTLQQFTTN